MSDTLFLYMTAVVGSLVSGLVFYKVGYNSGVKDGQILLTERIMSYVGVVLPGVEAEASAAQCSPAQAPKGFPEKEKDHENLQLPG